MFFFLFSSLIIISNVTKDHYICSLMYYSMRTNFSSLIRTLIWPSMHKEFLFFLWSSVIPLFVQVITIYRKSLNWAWSSCAVHPLHKSNTCIRCRIFQISAKAIKEINDADVGLIFEWWTRLGGATLASS